MKYTPYSYSRIATYQTCPQKFKYSYIDKIKLPYVFCEPLIKGGCVHSILEKYPSPSTHKYVNTYQYIADNFINSSAGNIIMNLDSKRETAIGLNNKLEPVDYSDKTAIFRGFVDWFSYKDNYLWIVDYKTGKLKDIIWQSFDQNMFYAIYFFQKYPKINNIKITYQYVEHENSDNSIMLNRKYLENYKINLIKNIVKIEQDNTFNINHSKLCDYCDFKDICIKENGEIKI